MTKRKLSFSAAKRRYIHRFTAEHMPQWAKTPCMHDDGCRYYAPQYRSDREWYDNTFFNGEHDLAGNDYCYSTNQSWPFGKWLDKPFR